MKRSALLGVLLLLCAGPAHATYSIVAADGASGQVGGAVASCVGDVSLAFVYASVPHVGAIHAQAVPSLVGQAQAIELLSTGAEPERILAEIVAADPLSRLRQYGIARLDGKAAGHTGARTMDHASHRAGAVAGTSFAIQGNILTGPEVLSGMEQVFAQGACDLPERLLFALEAASRSGGGDARCTSTSGIPADSAYLRVDAPDGSVAIELDVHGSGDENAVTLLRQRFDEWRSRNPCRAPGAKHAPSRTSERDSWPPFLGACLFAAWLVLMLGVRRSGEVGSASRHVRSC